jgi:hypothetical protein
MLVCQRSRLISEGKGKKIEEAKVSMKGKGKEIDDENTGERSDSSDTIQPNEA